MSSVLAADCFHATLHTYVPLHPPSLSHDRHHSPNGQVSPSRHSPSLTAKDTRIAQTPSADTTSGSHFTRRARQVRTTHLFVCSTVFLSILDLPLSIPQLQLPWPFATVRRSTSLTLADHAPAVTQLATIQ